MVRLTREDVLASLTVTGEIRARISVAVSSPINARITDIPVDVGDRVQVGDIVAVLDQDEVQARLREAVARLNQSEAALRNVLQGTRPEEIQRLRGQVSETRAGITQSQAELTTAQARLQDAQRRARRAERLFQQEFISRQDLDQAMTEEAAATGEVQRVRGNIQAARSRLAQVQQQLLQAQRGPTEPEISEARAARQAAAAQVQAIRSEVRDRYIRSSTTGVVVERIQDPGEIAIPGQPIVRIANRSTLEGIAFVEESDLPRVSVGDRAFIVLDSRPDRPVEGTVTKIGSEVNPENGTVEVTVMLMEEATDVRLLPGMTADINIITAVLPDALVIPATSVERLNGRTVVYLLLGRRLLRQPVEIRRISLDHYEVLQGVKAGDLIASDADPDLLKIRRVKPVLTNSAVSARQEKSS